MILFDIITLVVIGWMIFRGKREGLVSQILGIAGLVLGVVLATRYGEEVGLMLNIEPHYATIAGFVIVVVATALLALILSLIISKTLSLIKLKWLNDLLGILFSVVKGLAILSLFYAAIFAVNERIRIVEPAEFDKSASFNIVRKIADPLLKFWNESKPLDSITTPATTTTPTPPVEQC